MKLVGSNGPLVLALKLAGQTKKQCFYFLLKTYHEIRFLINLMKRLSKSFVFLHFWGQNMFHLDQDEFSLKIQTITFTQFFIPVIRYIRYHQVSNEQIKKTSKVTIMGQKME